MAAGRITQSDGYGARGPRFGDPYFNSSSNALSVRLPPSSVTAYSVVKIYRSPLLTGRIDPNIASKNSVNFYQNIRIP